MNTVLQNSRRSCKRVTTGGYTSLSPFLFPSLSAPFRSDPFRSVPNRSVLFRGNPNWLVSFRTNISKLFRCDPICVVPISSNPFRSNMFYSEPIRFIFEQSVPICVLLRSVTIWSNPICSFLIRWAPIPSSTAVINDQRLLTEILLYWLPKRGIT